MIPKNYLSFLWFFIKKYRFFVLLDLILVIVRDAFFLCGSAYVFKVISNKVNTNTLTLNFAVYYSIFYAFCITTKSLFDSLRFKINGIWKGNVEGKIYNEMFSYCIQHDISYFNSKMSGDIYSKIHNLVDKFWNISSKMPDIISSLILFFASLIIFYNVNFKLFLFAFLWLIFFHIILTLVFKRKMLISQETAKNKSKAFGIINDCFVNIRNIKIFATQKKEYRTIKKQSGLILRSSSKMLKANSKLRFTNYIFISLFVSISLLIEFLDFLNGKITLGTFLFILEIVGMVGYWISYEIQAVSQIIDDIGVIDNSLSTLIEPIKIKNKENSENINNIKGKINFKNIIFSYGGDVKDL